MIRDTPPLPPMSDTLALATIDLQIESILDRLEADLVTLERLKVDLARTIAALRGYVRALAPFRGGPLWSAKHEAALTRISTLLDRVRALGDGAPGGTDG